MGVESTERAWLAGAAGGPASGAALCDAEGPCPTPGRSARGRGAALGVPGEPGQKGPRGYEGLSGLSAKRALPRCPRGALVLCLRSYRVRGQKSDVSLRFLTKAQISHNFFPSKRPSSREIPSPASCSSGGGRVAAGSRQPAQAVAPRPPPEGFHPGFRISTDVCSTFPGREPLRAGRPTALHRARGADGQTHGGSDHGAQVAHRPLADSAGLSTRALWLQVDKDTEDKNTEDPAKRRPQGQEQGDEKGQGDAPAESCSAPSAPEGRRLARCPSSSGRPAGGTETSTGESVLLLGIGGQAAPGRRP